MNWCFWGLKLEPDISSNSTGHVQVSMINSLTLTSSVIWKSSWTTFSTSTMRTSCAAAATGSSTTSTAWSFAPGSSSASFLERFCFLRTFCLFSGSSGSTSSCLFIRILKAKRNQLQPILLHVISALRHKKESLNYILSKLKFQILTKVTDCTCFNEI